MAPPPPLVLPAGVLGAGAQLHPVELMLQATPVVQLVVVILVAMAVGCWFIMGAKAMRLWRAARASRRFLESFWEADAGNRWTPDRLEDLYVKTLPLKGSPIAAVFKSGYVELARILGVAPKERRGDTDNVERALRRLATGELTCLVMLPFLATTAATAPFIGLFGTVWGIMHSFVSIAGQKSASLDVVAPGIAEALIATAIGLVAAIPAVMAYNYFVRRIRVLEAEMEAFQYDFLNIVRRYFLTS